MQLRKLVLLAALTAAGAFVACTLNPQPLPPSDNNASFGQADASEQSDGGSLTSNPETPPTVDASAPPPNDEGGADGDGGDAGSDGGDGGDAGGDADAG